MFGKISLLVLFFVFCSNAAESPVIVKFKTDKILYDFNERIRFEAVVENPGPAREVVCKLTVYHGMNQAFTLPPQLVKLPEKKLHSLNFSWDSEMQEYGFAAVLDVDGVKSQPQIFEICHDC